MVSNRYKSNIIKSCAKGNLGVILGWFDRGFARLAVVAIGCVE